MLYVATINIPGYLPQDDEVHTFETPQEAWGYLLDELEYGELAWQPSDPSDPDGPQDRTETALWIEAHIDKAGSEPIGSTGTVYGPSYIAGPDEDTSTDLGLAYSVEVYEGEEEEIPDSYLDRVDGHWYIVRYDRTAPQIHAQDCRTCALLNEYGGTEKLFAWAENTQTDIKSKFDLTDAEFDALQWGTR